MGVTFHRICTPIFFQTWLQQYSRSAFFYPAHCSFSNPICFWSVWCRRTVIPGIIFTGYAKFQGIVSKWLEASYLAPRTFASSFVFLENFLFCADTNGSIEWPSPAPRLHIDDGFEIHKFHWEPWWPAVIKSPKFSARGTAPPLRLLHGSLLILVLWQISKVRSSGKWA